VSIIAGLVLHQVLLIINSRHFYAAWLFELAGGAIPDFEDTCVPKSQREASFTIAALHQWEIDVDDNECVDSAEEVRLLGTLLCSQFQGLASTHSSWD